MRLNLTPSAATEPTGTAQAGGNAGALDGIPEPNQVAAQLAALAALQPELGQLLIPAHDVSDPEVSIVIPALNEELTISEFVEWCKEGLRKARVKGVILIIDSSTDATPERALAAGARVLKSPKRGLGRAYIDSIPFIRG